MNTNPMMFSSDTNSTVSFQCQPPPSANHSTIATSSNRNPRGRPMGSKNKPKLNIMSITEPTAMLSLIHVPQGHDVVESIMDYARREHANVTILGGSGTIARVTLHNTSGGSTALTLHGPFTLVSFTGTYVYNDRYTLNTGATPPPHMAFGISLCTARGQLFQGAVGGKVIAGEAVSLTVSTFRNLEIYKCHPEVKDKDKDNGASNLCGVVNLLSF
ncbi:AT-hook motif nuclear-localized protein 17 [Cajanus cajan]|uniref:AT-hook motif nuclear-localized protein 17 n=1 Tax=Cajanus cajan TaxID=3821 RepID=UPI00098D8698|nr:AT-hook motif nuclear-localized protein 17 [Cajanus cajan]